jgi:tight adherence protein B
MAMNPLLIAPSAAFITVLLFGFGIYRLANHGGLIARRRLNVFAPAPTTAGTLPLFEGSPLLQAKSFSSIGLLDWLLHRRNLGERLSLELARAALPLRVGEYLLARWLLGLALALIVKAATGALPLAIASCAIGYFLPVLYVRRRQGARVRKFDDQLVDGLTLLANSLKSGYSFMQGMEAIAREMPAPIGIEFNDVLKEIRMGGSVEEALMSMSQRVRSADFELVVTAMVIQRQVGGNLTEILSNIAYTVRERHRILREVRVLTAQERASGYTVAALPVFLVFLLSLANPNYIPGMWHDPFGRILLGVGFVMAFLGLLVMRKLVDIDV